MAPAIDYARVAELYDCYVQTTADVPFFLEACRGVEGPVLELMCGTGRLSIPLLEAGVRLVCVDRSPEMLARLRSKLRERGLRATLLQQDVAALEPPGTFRLVLLPFQSLAEVLAEEDRARVFAAVHRCLEPGGRFICTVHNPPVRLRTVDGTERELGRFALPDGAGELVVRSRLHHDPASRTAHGAQIYELYDAAGRQREAREVAVRFAILEREEVEALALAAGFQVEGLLGDYAGAPFYAAESPFMIWVLAHRG